MAPAVALNVAVVVPAATVTDAATGSTGLLLDRATEAPPVGAAVESVTVQLVAEPEFRLLGLQLSDETRAAATRFTVALFDWLFSAAVSVAA
jgi:hypothetical protein